MHLSSLLNRFNEPETLKMAKLGRELRASGIDIIDLSLGEPDFDTPEYIQQSAIEAIQNNWSHYPPVAGYPDLREAICQKFKRDNQLDYKQENIIVSTGAKQSLANAVLATVDENDEVIIPTPYWVTYSELVKFARGKVVELPTTVKTQFKITAEMLENAITPATKLFMFSSPCNPSGAVYTKEELAALVKIFEKYPDIWIISDEIYEYINFVGKHESIAQFDSIKDRVMVINGLSKGYAMTGWRLGYMAGNTTIVKACEKIQGQFTSGANSITQRAAITALSRKDHSLENMQDQFAKRRRRVMELAAEIPGFITFEPQGAFYIFPDVTAYFGKTSGDFQVNNSNALSLYLLHQAHVSSVMGDAFGEPNCIRFSFANSMENIEKGFSQIKNALSKLQ
ncbi:MAG: pyridoxal phosphate-dependent aminotransferase [Bacteroidetes bacterium]|nr:pyridoxal phosphate-dependent aminotransferase [Bacteroidota bacterium]